MMKVPKRKVCRKCKGEKIILVPNELYVPHIIRSDEDDYDLVKCPECEGTGDRGRHKK